MSSLSFTYSGNIYDAAPAGQKDFPLTTSGGQDIPYLQKDHIHLYISDDDGDTWVEQTRPAQWDFVNSGTTCRLVTGISSGDWVRVQRITPASVSYVTFQASSLLTAEQLNAFTLFNTYLIQEQFDLSQTAALESATAATTAADAAVAAESEATAAIAEAAAAMAAASGVAASAAAAEQAAAQASAISGFAVGLIFGASATPPRPMAGFEVLLIPENAAFSVGKPGQIPFGVGPVLSPGAAFSGINRSDYFPIHHASGSFC